MVDESYHVLLVVNAIELIKQRRNLFITIPMLNLVKNMQLLLKQYTSPWQIALIQFVTANVSEIIISDYLKLLSQSKHIQPLNQLSVKIHLDDELAHCNIFKNLTKCIYANLNKRERIFFEEIFFLPLNWFADHELDVWECVLTQIGFEHAHSMLMDVKTLLYPGIPLHDSELISLGEELGFRM